MRFQEIFDKWEIDPQKYETWYDKNILTELFDAYKDAHFLPSDTQLAKAIGVSASGLRDIRKRPDRIGARDKVGIAVMVRYLDAMKIDPKKYLNPVTANTDDIHKAGHIRALKKREFLEVFHDAEEWGLMIEHADEIRKFLSGIKKLS